VGKISVGLGLYFSFFFGGLVSISGRYTVKRNTNSFSSSFLSPSPSSSFYCFYRSVCANIIYELCIMCTHAHTHTHKHTHTHSPINPTIKHTSCVLQLFSMCVCASVQRPKIQKIQKQAENTKKKRLRMCVCAAVHRPLYTHTSTGLQNVGFFCIFGVTWASA